MSKRRRLVMASDAAYYEFTQVARSSFALHNGFWPTTILDVGLTSAQRESLARDCDVVPYPTVGDYPPGKRYYFPAGLARLRMLKELTAADETMLYLDSDLVVLGCVGAMTAAFEASSRPFGLTVESAEERGWSARVIDGWVGRQAPPFFRRQHHWRRRPVLNTGVLLCDGNHDVVRQVGEAGVDLLQQHAQSVCWGEQSIVDSLIYEWEVPFWPISSQDHYYGKEGFLSHSQAPYEGPPPTRAGEPIVIRHFIGSRNKKTLRKLMPTLAARYIGPETPMPSNDAPGVDAQT